MKIDRLKIKLNQSAGYSLIHDSRHDVNTLAKALNMAIGKINELVTEINRLNTRE